MSVMAIFRQLAQKKAPRRPCTRPKASGVGIRQDVFYIVVFLIVSSSIFPPYPVSGDGSLRNLIPLAQCKGTAMVTKPSSALTGITAQELQDLVEKRFGVLPNFFRLAPETPEITEKLWGFAQAAYLDNPLPSLFKERLFVHLSRFCPVRYCIARHAGFLIGLGRPAGDKHARAQSIVEIVKLLQRPFPCGRELELRLSLCATCPAPLVEMPSADSQMEEAIFALAGHVFLQTPHALRLP